MPNLTLDLEIRNTDGKPIVDPTVFVRLSSPDGTSVAIKKIALNGQPVRLHFADGPSGFGLALRVSPSRFREGSILCNVDGDGRVVPRGPIRSPRRPSEWRPAFTRWLSLPAAFAPLQKVLGESKAFKLGRDSAPERFADDRYDADDTSDESRTLAKLCLLNMYGRLKEEAAPGRSPWFEDVTELKMATRERLVANVTQECWAAVRELSKTPPAGYHHTPVGDHRKNFLDVPGVTKVEELASVKTDHEKANLQFTVARATQHGQTVFMLDTDMDENGKLLLHTFDFIAHFFNGGTHPIDIHESLRLMFPALDLGYVLDPRVLVPEVAVRIVPPQPVPPPIAPIGPGSAVIRGIAVLGDSVPWGQGLLDAQKLSSLIAAAVASPAGPPPITMVAHSGAVIGASSSKLLALINGEVPRGLPSALQQCAAYPVEDAAGVDLVIVNGGINDVDIRFILNPFTNPTALEKSTQLACGADLVTLLEAIAARFPVARIAVLEYYPILSRLSRFDFGGEFLDGVGALPPMPLSNPFNGIPTVWDRILDNCRIFHEVSTDAIRTSVDRMNLSVSGSRFFAVDGGFGEENAALAPKAWLFGLSNKFAPEDPAAAERRKACDLFEADPIRREQCYRASAGHPNTLGAHAYAKAIVEALGAP